MLDPSRLSCLTWSARKRPDLLIAEIEISIDDAGVRMRSPMASSEQSWQAFRRCRDLGDYLMFDFGTNAGMPIPKAAFAPADLPRVEAFAKSAGKFERSEGWRDWATGVAVGVAIAIVFVFVVVVATGLLASGG